MMTQSISSSIKKNALMQLFCKRQSQPMNNNNPLNSSNKPIKRIKLNQQHKQDDPLYKILSWRDSYIQYQRPKQQTYKIVKQSNIVQGDQSKWATNVQGIWINIDWDNTKIEQLSKLQLSDKLINNGIVFIWGNKTNIGEMMDYFEKYNFFYVENFTFVMLNRNKIPQKSHKTINGNKSILNFFTVNKKINNQNNLNNQNNNKQQKKQHKDYQTGKVQNVNTIFCNENSAYFKQSQKVLYMFRKVCKTQPLQLRHQRTSDVYFTIGDSLKLDWKAKEIVYKMIQTLLINANYKDKQAFKLVQIWGDQDKPRKGWVTVVEEKKNNVEKDNATKNNIEQ